MADQMEFVLSPEVMAENNKATRRMDIGMDLGKQFRQTGLYTLENGKIADLMGKES